MSSEHWIKHKDKCIVTRPLTKSFCSALSQWFCQNPKALDFFFSIYHFTISYHNLSDMFCIKLCILKCWYTVKSVRCNEVMKVPTQLLLCVFVFSKVFLFSLLSWAGFVSPPKILTFLSNMNKLFICKWWHLRPPGPRAAAYRLRGGRLHPLSPHLITYFISLFSFHPSPLFHPLTVTLLLYAPFNICRTLKLHSAGDLNRLQASASVSHWYAILMQIGSTGVMRERACRQRGNE